MKIYLVAIAHLMWFAPANAQSTGNKVELFRPETELDLITIEGNMEQQLYSLDELLQRRPDINQFSNEELPPLPCLSALANEAIRQHLKLYGPLLAAEELQVIRELSSEEIDCLSRHFTLPQRFNPQEINKLKGAMTGKNEVIVQFRNTSIDDRTTLQQHLPFSKNYRVALRSKMRFSDQLSAGINLEKDPGENWWTTYGPDHTGYFIHFKSTKYPYQIIAGDYAVHYGQGLLFSPQAIGGVSGELPLIKRPLANVKPYTSMNEQGALKGVAISYDTPKKRMIMFASSALQDGRVTSSTDSTKQYFSRNSSGLHRTPEEIATKNTYRANCIGLCTVYKKEMYHLGVLAAWQNTNLAPAPTTEVYQSSYKSRKSAVFAGLDYQVTSTRYLIFGETALSDNYGFATTNSLLLHPERSISMAINFRGANGKCNAPLAQPFGTGNLLDGGFGFYTGINWKINQHSTVIAFLDNSNQSWLRFQTNTLQRLSTHGIRLIYLPNKSTEGVLLYRKNSSLSNGSGNKKTPFIQTEGFSQFRIQLTVKPSFGWQLRYRFEIKKPTNSVTNKSLSTLAFQDIRYQPSGFPVTITLRIGQFNIDEFENAIYAQESEPLYSYRSTAFYGNGFNYYLLLHGKITTALDGWIKIGSTTVTDRKFSDEWTGKNGKTKNEISLQIRWSMR